MDTSSDKRAELRSPCNEEIRFTIPSTTPKEDIQTNLETIVASVIDISATGMGLTTDVPLKKGQTVTFDKTLQKWELPEKGSIVWCYSHSNKYRTGLEFIL